MVVLDAAGDARRPLQHGGQRGSVRVQADAHPGLAGGGHALVEPGQIGPHLGMPGWAPRALPVLRGAPPAGLQLVEVEGAQAGPRCPSRTGCGKPNALEGGGREGDPGDPDPAHDLHPVVGLALAPLPAVDDVSLRRSCGAAPSAAGRAPPRGGASGGSPLRGSPRRRRGDAHQHPCTPMALRKSSVSAWACSQRTESISCTVTAWPSLARRGRARRRVRHGKGHGGHRRLAGGGRRRRAVRVPAGGHLVSDRPAGAGRSRRPGGRGPGSRGESQQAGLLAALPARSCPKLNC